MTLNSSEGGPGAGGNTYISDVIHQGSGVAATSAERDSRAREWGLRPSGSKAAVHPNLADIRPVEYAPDLARSAETINIGAIKWKARSRSAILLSTHSGRGQRARLLPHHGMRDTN